MKNKQSFWERFAHEAITPKLDLQADNDLFLLTEEEVSALDKIKKITYIKVAIAGALGVILLYLPYYFFAESLFPSTSIWIPVYNDYLEVEITFLLYSVVLVVIEILFLTHSNVKAVAAISHACGHPNPKDESFQSHLEALVAVSLEKQQKQLQSIGINPFKGLSRLGIMLFQMLLKLKAAISNVLFTLLVKKILGRYALRLVLDFAGIPIYAGWNIWGSKKVMDEARIRIMAPPLIKRCIELIYSEQQHNSELRSYLYDTLQLISESKRDFHYNHFLLGLSLLDKFSIPITEKPDYQVNFIKMIPALKLETREAIQKIFVFGIIIDGSISRREKKVLRYLIQHGVIPYSEAQIIQWASDYYHGLGIDDFFSPAPS